ncbi:MAG TPA: FHA domain-containing protein [Solirubrobacteraceae bacterium]|nr:FHA domain-containing protein [Solirubrobacteraceae bacterium]
MLAPVAGEINLEVIEGPDAGKQIVVDRPIVIGRDAHSDLVLDDGEVSGQHVRITPAPDGSATVEDLGSTNGTFVNQNELEGPARLDPGDHLLVGVSVLEMRTADDLRLRGSGVIQLPPSLAIAERTPTYVNPEVRDVEQQVAPVSSGDVAHPTVDRYLDVKVRRRAQLAPLALLTLIAIALILYFSVK